MTYSYPSSDRVDGIQDGLITTRTEVKAVTARVAAAEAQITHLGNAIESLITNGKALMGVLDTITGDLFQLRKEDRQLELRLAALYELLARFESRPEEAEL